MSKDRNNVTILLHAETGLLYLTAQFLQRFVNFS